MNPLDERVRQRPGDGPNARLLLKDDREWVVCFSCPTKHGRHVMHQLKSNYKDFDAREFADRHPTELGHLVLRMGPEQMERAVRAAERRKRLKHDSISEFIHNASVTEVFGTVTSLDLTGIGIASSTTAGWCSCWIDNSSALALDIMVWYYSQAVNTAAGSQKAHWLYGPGAYASGDLPVNTAGNTVTNSSTTSGTYTFIDVTANPTGFPLLKVCPYITTNKPISSNGFFGFAKGHDMWCPKFVWLALANVAGPTIATGGSPATAIKYAGATNLVQ